MGPTALGRGVVVRPGQPVAAGWRGAPVVRVDGEALADPASTVAVLHEHWVGRRPVVVELAVDLRDLREPESEGAPPYELGPAFEFLRERLAFLVTANNYDARGEGPRWGPALRAVKAGLATAAGPADVVLPDGRPAWIDGGPRGPVDEPGIVLHRESIDCGRLGEPAASSVPTLAGGLAPDQLTAVAHPAGPARIIAPAGSGKTRVLTERVRHLIFDRRVEPEFVTALAYNNRAAAEMRARLAEVPAGNIRTLHSFGFALLRQQSRLRTIDEREARQILQPLVDVPRLANQDVLLPFLEGMADIRVGLRRPAQAEAREPDAPGLAAVFSRYRDILRANGLLDFDEHIYAAIELLLADPGIRRRAQQRCRHLLVDEFQDLTPAHMLMVRLLSAPAYQVFGVGDDDQTIYGYAGADVRWLTDFAFFFPGAAAYELEVNYRCPPEVVAAAGRLLAANRARVPKTTHPAPGREETGEGLRVVKAEPERAAAETATVVAGWLADGAPPPAVAVLTRVNSALLPAQAALMERGVAVESPLQRDLLNRTGLRAALAYLRCGLSPRQMAAADVEEVLRRPPRKLPRDVIARVRGGRSLGGLGRARRGLPRWQAEAITEAMRDIEVVQAAVPSGMRAVVRAIRTTVGLGRAMEELDAVRDVADRSTHLDDLDALSQLAVLHPEAATFEVWLLGLLEASQRGGVLLSTVHRVKGKEWDRVVVFGARDGLFPHQLSSGTVAAVEEERRVFHVALTRARVQAVVIAETDRPSPFLAEMGVAVRTPRHPAHGAGRTAR